MLTIKNELKLSDKIKMVRVDDLWHMLILMMAWIPGKIYKFLHGDVWVITEYPENARDNGYWMFRYMRKRFPKKKVFYPIKKKSSDYKKVAKLGNTVEFGSFRHYILFWAANKYLGTTKFHGFPDERTCSAFQLRNLAGFKYIFLNHGVARGVSSIVDGERSNYEMVVAMSEGEKETIVNINHQPADKVYALGFCRHDNLDDKLLDKKTILFMPTWRNWLDYRHETDPEVIENIKKDYLNSEYYKRCKEIIESKRLQDFLEKNDLHFVMYLHGYAQAYSSYFKPTSDRIEIAKKEEYFVQDILKKAAYLITDYSSVIFDFAYMKKPCVYYQFDAEEFAEKQYAESEYYSYEKDGFGPIFKELDEVIDHMEERYSKDFEMEEKYKNRVLNYFPSFDKKHCERTYDIIKSL